VTLTRQTLTTELLVAFAVLVRSVAFAEVEDAYEITREGRRVSVGVDSSKPAEIESEKEKKDEKESPEKDKSPLVPPGPLPASRPVRDKFFMRPISPPAHAKRFTVIGVLGSDGVVVFDGTRKARVRYLGVKAPRPGTPIAGAAERANRELMLGKEVSVVYGSGYGTVRTNERQAFVFVHSPKDRRSVQLVNAYMIENGYAAFSSSRGVNRYQDFFRAIERRARTRQVGLWRRRPVAGATQVLPPVAGPETYSERLQRIRRARRPVAGAAELEIPVRTEKTEEESAPKRK